MELEKEHIHRLAIHYFEGRITLQEEEELFLFVNACTDNYAMFRLWEKEWMQSATPDRAVISEWKHLQRRVQIQCSMAGIGKDKRYSLRQAITVAAMIAIIVAGGAYGTWSFFQKQADRHYFALITAYGEKSKMMLTDGTVVWLNAGSTLRYANDFSARNRIVQLEGEAYFEVEKQADDAPFTVRTSCYDVVVKGTKFNVTSYPEDPISTTTLLEGAVDILYEGRRLEVKPGELLCFDKEKKDFSSHHVDASQYRSWIEGRVEYDEITLGELAVRLSRKYDVKIHLEPDLDENAKFRVSLRNEETIGQFLQALSDIIPIRFERQGQDIYIKKQ